MSVKFDNDKYKKSKVKATFNDIEIYNPQTMRKVYRELCELIKQNSGEVEVEDGLFDVQVNNPILILRFMLINLSNIENEEYWNSKNDDELDEILITADGDFKEAVDTLLDIIVEVSQNIRKQESRKLKQIENKIIKLAKTFQFNNNVDEKLKEFGIDTETLDVIQSLLEGQPKEQNLIKDK